MALQRASERSAAKPWLALPWLGLIATLFGSFLVACAPATPPAEPPYVLEAVVAREIAALEAELAAHSPGAASAQPPDEVHPTLALAEVRDLLGAVTGSEGKLRLAALDDLKALGSRATPALRDELYATDDEPNARAAAVEALAAIATRSDDQALAAAEALLERLDRARREVDPEPWLRAHCAWRFPLPRHDWARERLLLALKYETDYETVIWLARVLEGTGSLAGVVGLDVIARGAQPERAAEATAVLQAWAEARGLAGPAELLAAYHAGEFVATDEAPPPSARARLATWRRIGALAEWQLRGVDDARFVLVQSGPSVVSALSQALHDENRYIRVHSAQVLERMGPRAKAAADALIDALRERELGPQAARALAKLGDSRAATALCAALAPERRFELRVAAARSLAELGATGCESTLTPLLALDTPDDLRAGAAAALLSVRGFDDARAELTVLATALAANGAETRELEDALERWLVRAGEPAAATLESWRTLAADEQRAARRAELVLQLAK
ncbi:MAG: hypothetical protein L6Q99_00460 [Planctomycetes bacterium]|nr:hypothetical protein [Planctomycetota bacterium]